MANSQFEHMHLQAIALPAHLVSGFASPPLPPPLPPRNLAHGPRPAALRSGLTTACPAAHVAASADSAREHFERHGARVGIGFERLPPGLSLDAAMETAEPFFRVELPSGEHLLHRMAANPRKHPLQFGREVVANILGQPQLSDWKNCLPKPTPERLGTEEQLEGLAAEEFKAAFAPFDPMK